jgi:hypothetical protein
MVDTQALQQLHQRLLYEVLNEGKLGLMKELVADDHVLEFRGGPRLRPGGQAAIALVYMVRTGVPDVTFTIEDQIAEGHKVATRFVWSGLQDGPLGQVPATGKKLYGSGSLFSTERDGRLVHTVIIMDLVTPLGEIGALKLGFPAASPEP